MVDIVIRSEEALPGTNKGVSLRITLPRLPCAGEAIIFGSYWLYVTQVAYFVNSEEANVIVTQGTPNWVGSESYWNP